MKAFGPLICAAVLALSPLGASTTSAGAATASAAVVSGSQIGAELIQVGGYRYHNPRRADRRHYQHRYYDNRHRRVHRHPPPRYRSRGSDLGPAIAGAIIGGIIVHQFHQQPRPQPHAHGSYLSSHHINWCRNRWRSYRVVDNSYQPYQGPRRVCISPYGPT
jgi:hypothetical protein